MKTYKRIFCFIALLSTIIVPLFSMSYQKKELVNPFPSEENLKIFTMVDFLSEENIEYLDDTNISLITISEGLELYSWFGHSAIVIESPGSSIVYDYGVFNFDSENFYLNFIQGKMYYLLYLSYKESRLQSSIIEDRTIKQLQLNLDNYEKASIINFLHYNSQSENQVYLYQFFTDNCATRIRDIVDWSSDGDFKKWAINQPSEGTFRELASRSLEQNLLVYWVLNAFLGHPSDTSNTRWDDMFLPLELDQAIKQYAKFGNNEQIVHMGENSEGFVTPEKYSSKLIFFITLSFIMSIIAILLKRNKQIRNSNFYGVYNIVIISFLLIVSSCIFFLNFFSNINPTWFNENLVFLNPISMGLLLFFSIKTLAKKKNQIKKLALFERLCRIYSHSIFILIILKLLLENTFYQNNLNIILPIYIYFVIQGFFIRSDR